MDDVHLETDLEVVTDQLLEPHSRYRCRWVVAHNESGLFRLIAHPYPSDIVS
jgi:hypothetical protein